MIDLFLELACWIYTKIQNNEREAKYEILGYYFFSVVDKMKEKDRVGVGVGIRF